MRDARSTESSMADKQNTPKPAPGKGDKPMPVKDAGKGGGKDMGKGGGKK